MVNQAYVSAISGNLISFVSGTAFSWSSPIIPKLNDSDVDNIPFHRRTTSDENSWIGSLLPLGAIFGPLIWGYLADKIGRKLTITLLGFPFLLSFLTLAFAECVELYYAARFITGIAIGGVFTVMPMYIGEIAEDSNRGTLGSTMNILITSGLLFSYVIGPYVSIMAFNLILAVVPAIFMIVFYFVAPESPHYYIAKGDYKAAVQCLNKLRGSSKNDNELNNIKTTLEKAGKGSPFDLIKSKGLIKAIIISLSLVGFQQLSGNNAVLFYAQTIFQSSGGDIQPEICSIIVGIVFFATSFVTPLLVDKLGRKVLLYFSSIGMVISEVLLGLYFYLKNHDHDVECVSWLPVVSMVAYIITYNCGFGPLPWAIMGELFPSHVKSVASSLTSAFCWVFSFLITKFFQSIVDSIGMEFAFWIFAFFCVLSFFFTYYYMIETKGKSLQEIQDALEL